MRRVAELDAVRGLAAMLVMIHHDVFVSRALDGALIRQTPLRGLDAGRPFVLLFFVLSGFVLSRSLGERAFGPREYLIWIVQRAVRLLIPAAASVLLAALLYGTFADPDWAKHGNAWFSWNWSLPPNLFDTAAQGALIAQPKLNTVLWSLAVEWRLTFLIPAMVLLARSSRSGIVVLIGIGLALVGLAGGSVPGNIFAGEDLFSTIRSTLYFTLPFALGVALDRSGACDLDLDRWAVAAALLACVGLARVDQDLGAFLWSALVIWAAQLPSPVRDAFRLPPMQWLGRVSFSLYLVHVPVMLGAFHALHATLTPLGIAVLAIAVSLPAAWAFHALVERPAHRLARAVRSSPALLALEPAAR